MVEIEQYCKKCGEWNSNEDVCNSDIPEMYKPASISGRKERFAGRQDTQAHISHPANVNESGEENDCERCAVVFDEHPDIMIEQRTCANDSA